MAFHTPKMFQDFYRYHGIQPLPAGAATPWPNRAESAIRIFKRLFAALLHEVEHNKHRGQLRAVTARTLLRKAAAVRNTVVTIDGKAPMELAFGRRPRDLLNVGSMDPTQLSTAVTVPSATNEELQG